MKDGPDLAAIAAAIGDPARANILCALMCGQALTLTELAREAGVALPTASGHLARLEAAGLVAPRRQGRHKYFALAGASVAEVLEGLTALAAERGHLRVRPGPRDPALRKSRVCYDHLAGALGVRLFDSLRAQGGLDASAGLTLTAHGVARMAALGVDVAAVARGRAALVRECLDWSERRPHLGGALGRALLTRMTELGWARREAGTRLVRFTPDGERRFCEAFPLPLTLAA
jgi:DNA-binding transcriptional ArsR family regulator